MNIAVITNKPVNIYQYSSGREYYLYSLSKVSPRFGISVQFITKDQLVKNVEEYGECDSYHLYYLGITDSIALRRIVKGKRLIHHVYHIGDSTRTRSHEILWKWFLISLQAMVDAYLVTAKSAYLWLRFRAPFSRHFLAEPYYGCSCDSIRRFDQIVAEKSKRKEVRLLYVGRLSRNRSSPSQLLRIGVGVANRIRKSVKLVIVSKDAGKESLLRHHNCDFTIRIISGRIDDSEKCKLYRESDFFILLAKGNVAMNPPITILESVYHGTIPIVSSNILDDLEVPSELVADTVDAAVDRITYSCNNPGYIDNVASKLRDSFRRFYDAHRFATAIKRTI